MSINKIDTDLCVGCEECVQTCPMDVIRMDREAVKATITYPEDCQICHLCRLHCPEDAIAISPEKCPPILVAWA